MDKVQNDHQYSYFCTVGSGLEKFCQKELENINGTTILEIIVGKVFFRSDCQPSVLLALKTIERLFVLVSHSKQFLCKTSSKGAFYNLRNLLEKDIQWQLCLNQWILFRDFLNLDSVHALSCNSKHSRNCSFDSRNEVDTEPPQKKMHLDDDAISFRVSCKSTGVIRRFFSSYKLSQFIGCSLTSICSWKIDLKNPQLEVYVHASEEYFTIGLPILVRPLSERSYLKHIALRSTVCYAMLLCAGELPMGSVLFDPMCGAGTLITEAAINFQSIMVIGADIDTSQLEKAHENIRYADCDSNVELLHADVTHLPLKDACVNAIICDLPFGNKFGTPEEVKKLLPLALMEMNRILTAKGKIVLLINEALKKCLFDSLPVHKINNSCTSVIKDTSKLSSEHIGHEDSSRPEGGLSCNLIRESCLNIPPLQDHILQWKSEENHIIKLGEMIASICVFEKQ